LSLGLPQADGGQGAECNAGDCRPNPAQETQRGDDSPGDEYPEQYREEGIFEFQAEEDGGD